MHAWYASNPEYQIQSRQFYLQFNQIYSSTCIGNKKRNFKIYFDFKFHFEKTATHSNSAEGSTFSIQFDHSLKLPRII